MATRNAEPTMVKKPGLKLTNESRQRTGEAEPHLGRVNLWESDTHLVMATPVPGAQPSDLRVTLTASRLEIQGRARTPDPVMEEQHVGTDQALTGNKRRYWMREWLGGTFSREMVLPVPVQASGSEASLGNGVLVIALPKAKAFGPASAQEIPIVRRDFVTRD